jgi:cytochrome c biogenesis protein CcmG, thiol:disulfide interchange protein DsbE
MRHRARWAAAAVGVGVLVLAVILAVNVGSDTQLEQQQTRMLGKPLPDARLETLEGQSFNLGSLAGKAVIVNFWNTWCAPCEEELPVLRDFHDAHEADSDFAMVGISRDERVGTDELRTFVSDRGLDWTIALDPEQRAALGFGTIGQPETFAVSPDGQIVSVKFGPARSVAELDAMLAAARRA